MAASLLAKTEHARLLVRDLRRARVRVTKPAALSVENPVEQTPSKVAEMNTPYGLEIVESCLTCKLRKDHWFCGLSTEVSEIAELGKPSEHVSRRRGPVRRRTDAARRLRAVLGQGEAFDHLA